MATPDTTPTRDRPSTEHRAGWLAVRIGLWAAASVLLGFAPLFYILAGLGEDATEGSRIGAAAVPGALAWPLILCAAVLALRTTGRSPARVAGGAFARSLLLLAYAAAVLAAARALGAAVTIHGDASWTVLWLATVTGWLILSVACLRRSGS